MDGGREGHMHKWTLSSWLPWSCSFLVGAWSRETLDYKSEFHVQSVPMVMIIVSKDHRSPGAYCSQDLKGQSLA